jgi:hypothetical protein
MIRNNIQNNKADLFTHQVFCPLLDVIETQRIVLSMGAYPAPATFSWMLSAAQLLLDKLKRLIRVHCWLTATEL